MKKTMKAVAALMLMMAVICTAGCSKSDDPNNGGNNIGGNQNIHIYVDLGLPSGTLWATCNVGATTPEGYGDYFAWAETQPKSIYNWYTYKYHDGTTVTKYRPGDKLTTLQPSDDAATANWGSGWRTPSYEEWCELYQNTTNTWMTCDGVKGRLFTASNGNSLFLPAAGYYWGEECVNIGTYGLYWSSSLCIDSPKYAGYFYFYSNYTGVNDNRVRAKGHPIRPVRSTK